MQNRDILQAAAERRRNIDFHRHRQHGWRRSPLLLTAAMRFRRNYGRLILSSATSPDDELPRMESE